MNKSHHMNRNGIVVLLMILGSACLLIHPASEAGLRQWNNNEIGQVKSRTKQIRTDTKEMADDFRVRKNKIKGDVKTQLTVGQELFQETIEQEKNGLLDFVNGEGCQIFYDELAGIKDDLNMLINQFLEFGLDGGVWGLGPDALTFFTADRGFELPTMEDGSPTKTTCKLIYPMKRTLEAAEVAQLGLGVDFLKAGELLRCANEDVTELLEYAQMNIADPQTGATACQNLVDNRQDIRSLSRRISRGGLALKLFGNQLEKRKERDFNVAIWGWVGFTIKANTLQKIGKASKGGAEGMKWVMDHVEKKLSSCEREFILESLEVLANPRLRSGRF